MSFKIKLFSLTLLVLLLSPASHAAPKIDANSDDEITREEYTAYFDADFNKKDKNFDGRLTANEMRDWSKEQSRKAMAEAFKQIDPNGDGKLTEDEYEQSISRDIAQQDSMTQSYLDQTFDDMDEDHNDHVSRLEYENYVERTTQNALEMMTKSMRDHFKLLDKDKDGLVTEAEYTGQLERYDNLFGETSLEDKESNSVTSNPVTLDGNNDGVITRTEQREYAAYRFEQKDNNNDGIITKSEAAYLFMDSANIEGDRGVYLESQIIMR